MRIVREVIRYVTQGLSNRKTAKFLGISPTTVSFYKKRFYESGLSYRELSEIDDDKLKTLLGIEKKDKPRKPLPDMAYIHSQMSHKGTTLKLLWQEYKQESDFAYEYSQFANYYRSFKSKLHPIMRFNHKMAEKVFVDFLRL